MQHKPPYIGLYDQLLIIGGKLDGQRRCIGPLLFPWFPELMPAGFTVDGETYVLDRKRRAWVYKPKWPVPFRVARTRPRKWKRSQSRSER